ncbi:MAG TPA: N-acetylglucosamine-6-phosphate deacetylase [Dehalococcoidia bacterium]|nr:N-acetylglucosamine-6-phosphate deacetylase [Dehalococcoidia bacterium]
MSDRIFLRGARVAMPDGTVEAADVVVEDGTFAEVAYRIEAGGVEVVELAGYTLVPGFIDLHVHGGGGHSLITPDCSEIEAYARWAAGQGATGFLATVCTGSLEGAMGCLEAVGAARVDGGAELLGANLEGPFVNEQRRGALPESWPQAANVGAFRRLLGAAGGELRLMTVAPELPGALGLIREAIAEGVRVSVGHTDATYEEAREGLAAGATQVTHAFNAMRPFHHREPGPIGAAIEAGAIAEVIADGVHLHPAAVRTLVRAFGPERVALITDGVTPAGLESGTFRIGAIEATRNDGEMRLPDGTIAGSVATMADVFRNVVKWGIADVGTASVMASGTPARALGLEGRKGRIAAGCDADLVALTDDLQVAKTWVAGKLVFGGE